MKKKNRPHRIDARAVVTVTAKAPPEDEAMIQITTPEQTFLRWIYQMADCPDSMASGYLVLNHLEIYLQNGYFGVVDRILSLADPEQMSASQIRAMCRAVRKEQSIMPSWILFRERAREAMFRKHGDRASQIYCIPELL